MKKLLTIKYLRFLCCLLLLCMLLPNAGVEAQTPLLDTLIVAVAPSSPPFVDEAFDGNLVGFDIDILKNLVRLAGLRIRYEKANFSYILPGVSTQLYDAAIGCLFVSETRRKIVNFTNPYFATGLVLVVQANNETLHSVADLTATVRVSVKLGTAAETYIRQQTPTRILPAPSAMLAMQQLTDHSADAVIIDEMIAKAFMKAHPEFQLRILGFLTTEQCAIAVNKNNSALLSKLNQALVRLKNSRQYDLIYHKWFGDRAMTIEPLLHITPTVPITVSTPATPVVTNTVEIASPITPTQRWAGVYYLTAQATSSSNPNDFSASNATSSTNITAQPTATVNSAVYQIVTLSPDGLWSGAELPSNNTALTTTEVLSVTSGILNQHGAWQADVTGHITATVLAFQAGNVAPVNQGVQRLQYQLAIDANGLVRGQYTRTSYRLGDNPLAASLTTAQTQTLSVTGQRVKP